MREPATGKLLAFAEGRKFSCADHGWNDLVLKTSADGGATWSPLAVVRSESTNGHEVTIGNPAPIVVASQPGVLLLPFSRNNIQAGVLRSADFGATWAYSANLTVPSDWSWIATGPPGGIQLASGRLVLPVDNETPGSSASLAYLSDDEGATWYLSTNYVSAANECQAAELSWLSNSTHSVVHLSARAAGGSARLAATSTDGGKTWGKPWQTVKETECEGSVVALPASRRLVMSSA